MQDRVLARVLLVHWSQGAKLRRLPSRSTDPPFQVQVFGSGSTTLGFRSGGFQERCEGESRIYNTHLVIDEAGAVQATYRKIHLYDVPMVGLVESKQALPGDLGLVACDSPCGRLGVTICYDMRFPELYQKLTFAHGAQILLMPSAFAMKTGEAHWETLLRARAIETQCYVVASAQAGLHNTEGNRRRSWGHSLAIDPWGKIVASFGGEGTGVECFEIDLDLVDSTRANMPMAEHRRYDIYGDVPHQLEGGAPRAANGGAACSSAAAFSSAASSSAASSSASLLHRLAFGALGPLAAIGLAAITSRLRGGQPRDHETAALRHQVAVRFGYPVSDDAKGP